MNIKNELIQRIDYLLSTSNEFNVYNRNLLLIERKDCDFRFVDEVYYNNNLVFVVRYSSFVRVELNTNNRYIIKECLDCLKDCVAYEEGKENEALRILKEEYSK